MDGEFFFLIFDDACGKLLVRVFNRGGDFVDADAQRIHFIRVQHDVHLRIHAAQNIDFTHTARGLQARFNHVFGNIGQFAQRAIVTARDHER